MGTTTAASAAPPAGPSAQSDATNARASVDLPAAGAPAMPTTVRGRAAAVRTTACRAESSSSGSVRMPTMLASAGPRWAARAGSLSRQGALDKGAGGEAVRRRVVRRGRAVRVVFAAALVLVGLLLPAGCTAASPGVQPGVGMGATGRLTVVATPPLVGVLARLGKDFQADNPTLDFAVRPAAGADLADGDVVALDEPALRDLGAQVAGSPVPFAANQLVIAIALGNPLRIAGLADLARPGLRLAVCVAVQPCGAAATAVLGGSQPAPTPTVVADDANAAIAEVRAGRADAALVYRTDARAAKDDVDTVEFPQSRRAVAHYQLATLQQATNPGGAERLLAFLTSAYAGDVLSAAGFQPA